MTPIIGFETSGQSDKVVVTIFGAAIEGRHLHTCGRLGASKLTHATRLPPMQHALAL